MPAELRLEPGQPGVLEPAFCLALIRRYTQGLCSDMVWARDCSGLRVFISRIQRFSEIAKSEKRRSWRPLRDDKRETMRQQTTKNSGRRQLTIILVMAAFSLVDPTFCSFQPRAVQAGGRRTMVPLCSRGDRAAA